MSKIKKYNKFLIYSLTSATAITNIIPALATETLDENNNSIAQVNETTEISSDSVSETSVYASVKREFTVTIPKSLTLDGTTKKGSYTVNVVGSIAGTDKISVVPDETFKLSSSGVSDITASINQDKTEWSYDEIIGSDAIIGNGTIDASDLSAGKWNGTFNFNINLEEGKILTLSDDSVALGINDSTQIAAYLDDEDVTNQVNWQSDNENITVTNGLIETKASAKVGDTAIITVTAQDTQTLSAMTNTLSDLGILTIAKASNGLEAQVIVTIIDINFVYEEQVINSINIKPNESKVVNAIIIPESVKETVTWTSNATAGINLIKNGNEVTIKVAEDMPTGNTYVIIASYGNFSKLLEVNIIDDHICAYNDGETTKEPTCTEAGIKTFSCSCGNSYTEEIPIIDHTPINGYCTMCNAPIAGLYSSDGTMLTNWENSGIDNTCSNANTIINNSYANTTTLVISNDVANVKFTAFSGCKNLTNVIFINDNTTIGYAAFNNCTGLKSVVLPKNLTSIGDYMFTGCTNLTNIEIPASVTSIRESAFLNCSSLESLNLPNGITSIGRTALQGCTKLTTIELPSTVNTISDSAFFGCTGKLIINSNIPPVTSDCSPFNGSEFTDITIGDEVTRIESGLFNENTELTTIIIGSKVSYIGTNVFDGCEKLSNIIFKDPDTWYIGDSEGEITTQIPVNGASTNVDNFKNTYSDKYWTKQ